MGIAVIWWTSGFGLWTANYIKKYFSESKIIITWRDIEKWEKIAKENNLNFTNNNKEAIKGADIVIFAVPISKMEETIKTYVPYAKENSVVVDVCSIKWFPSQTMKKYAPESCLIIPIHPMFWPYIQEITDQIFVLTPLDEKTKKDERYKFLVNFLEKKNAKIIETTPKYHDKMMAVVQWLTHITMFSVWETIRRLWIDIQDSLNFVSPIYKLMINSVARYVGHDPKLYWDIQMFNTEILNVHNEFMGVIKDFNKVIEAKDEYWFLNIIEATKQGFGKKITQEGQKYTDKIIYLMWEQVEKINNNIWKEMIFKNIYSWIKIVWKVIEIMDDNVILESWQKIDLLEYVID